MTIDVDEFDRLRKRVEQLKSERDRAEGALAELRKRLKDEFGCASSEQALVKLKKLEARKKRLEAQFAEELAKFEQGWDERLKGD